MNRIQIIQSFINKYNYKNYLEIGIQNGDCFKGIKCDKKTGVDPDPSSAATIHKTSDDFFKDNKEKFDVIFIDGLHEAETVHRDILNSLECLNEKGVILMHDCLPTTKHMQEIPLTNQVEWTGDCWKAFVKLRTERSDLHMFVINTDWGVGFISRAKEDQGLLKVNIPLTYENFVSHKNEWMNIINVDDFVKLINE